MELALCLVRPCSGRALSVIFLINGPYEACFLLRAWRHWFYCRRAEVLGGGCGKGKRRWHPKREESASGALLTERRIRLV